jgi:predicted aspartyl protease
VSSQHSSSLNKDRINVLTHAPRTISSTQIRIFFSSLQTDSGVNTEESIISSIGIARDDSWYVIIHMDDSPVKFKVDTGAQCNVLLKQMLDKVVKTPNLQPGPRVTAYNRQPVRVVGQQQLCVLFNNIRVDLSCVVAENVDIPVLGLPSCKALNVVKLVDSLNMGTMASPLTETSVANLVSKYVSVFEEESAVVQRVEFHSNLVIQFSTS